MGDGRCAGHGEAGAEVIPEPDGLLGTGFHQAEEGVAAIAAGVRAGAARDLAAGYVGADVILRAVGVQRHVRPIEHRQQIGLERIQSLQLPVEQHEAGLAREDGVESGFQLGLDRRRRRAGIGFQIGVEFPDAVPDRLLGGLPVGGESVELCTRRSACTQHSAWRPTSN